MKKVLTILLFSQIGFLTALNLENHTIPDVYFNLPLSANTTFKIEHGSSKEIQFGTFLQGVHSFTVTAKKESIISVTFDGNLIQEIYNELNFTEIFNASLYNAYSPSGDVVTMGKFTVTGLQIGYTEINITLFNENGRVLSSTVARVATELTREKVADIFSYGLIFLSIFNFVNMGSKVDRDLLKRIIRKPIGPGIGFVGQYLSMPLVAYGLGIFLFKDEPLFRIGQFATGICPGGLLSNIYTFLIGGCLTLSLSMTVVSSVTAAGMIPLWVYTLGIRILEGENLIIPYTNIFTGIAFLVITIGFGFSLQFCCPKVSSFLEKIMAPVSVISVIFSLTVGVYANRQILEIFTWKIVVCGLLQALAGHIVGAVLAVIFRRPLKEIIAISIEVALQNNSIALVFLDLTFESPANSIALALPFSAFFTTQMILLPILIGSKIYFYFKKPKDPNEVTEMHDNPIPVNDFTGYRNYATKDTTTNSVLQPPPP